MSPPPNRIAEEAKRKRLIEEAKQRKLIREAKQRELIEQNKPKFIIGIDEAKRFKIPTEGNITKIENGAVTGSVTIVITECLATWAAAGYCVAGLVVAIIIADAFNGINPIAPDSGLDTLSRSLDKALGKPGVKIKKGLNDAGGTASDTAKDIIENITKHFSF